MNTPKLKELDLSQAKRDGQHVVSHPGIKSWDDSRNYLVRVTFRDGTSRTFTSHAHSSQMYGLGFTDSCYPKRDYALNGKSYLNNVDKKNPNRNSFTFEVWEIEEKA